MAEFIEVQTGGNYWFGIESDVNNFQAYQKTNTIYKINYPLGAILEGNSAPAGTQYGGIVAVKTAYPASLIATSSPLIGDLATPTYTLAVEDGAGAIDVVGLATSSVGYFDGVEREYIFAFGGDGVNDFAQIYVNGVKDGEGTAVAATFPVAVPAQTPINTQTFDLGGTVYLMDPITSYADLEAEVDKFKAGI